MRKVFTSAIAAQALPQGWVTSQGFVILKPNGKVGCAGNRVVHSMAPLGKAALAATWKQQSTEEHAKY